MLWAANEGKPPKEQLSMRAIAKQLGLPKTTVLEWLSGRRVGERQMQVERERLGYSWMVSKQVNLTVTVTITKLQLGHQVGHQAGHSFGALYW